MGMTSSLRYTSRYQAWSKPNDERHDTGVGNGMGGMG